MSLPKVNQFNPILLVNEIDLAEGCLSAREHLVHAEVEMFSRQNPHENYLVFWLRQISILGRLPFENQIELLVDHMARRVHQ